MDGGQMRMSAHGESKELRGLPDVGQLPVTWRLGVLNLVWVPCSRVVVGAWKPQRGVLLTLNS